jgi:hypothetical protein
VDGGEFMQPVEYIIELYPNNRASQQYAPIKTKIIIGDDRVSDSIVIEFLDSEGKTSPVSVIFYQENGIIARICNDLTMREFGGDANTVEIALVASPPTSESEGEQS